MNAKLFDTYMNLKNVIINIETVSRMNEVELTQMLHSFNHYGFAILQCIDLNHFALDFPLLSKIFGKPTRHNRADDRGIVPIRPLPGYQAYLGASNEPHPLHTDGPFEELPPKVVALQCENPDPVGGFSQLVSCRAIYQYLKEHDCYGLQLLFQPDIFAIKRDNQSGTRAIFDYKDGRISMAFRTNDGKAKISIAPVAAKTFDLIQSFINDPKNQLSFKLERGQILIIDNYSVLHGRTGFSQNSLRKLYRLNFDGESKYTSELVFGFEP